MSLKTGSKEIKGPKTNAPEKAVEGFLRSNNLEKKQIFVKKTEKGEFFFYKSKLWFRRA